MFTYVGAVSLKGHYIEYEKSHFILDIHCTGNESTIWNCSQNQLEDYECSSNKDAAVICQGMKYN